VYNFPERLFIFDAHFYCARKSFWHTARTMTLRASLPDLDTLDSAALKTLIFLQQEQLQSKDEQLLRKDEQLASREAEIEQLKLLIAKLRRMQFGRKSEKVERQIEQLQLRLDELEASRAEQTTSSAAPPAALERPRGSKPVRRPPPEQLPREMRKILQAEAPSRPIARGLAGPGLLAHVLVSKYCHHLPLYRQEEIYEREGVELDRATLADWVGGASGLLQPLVEALRRHVMSATKLHADDTPVPVLAPGLGKTKLGRLWTYVRDDRPAGDKTPPAVWFAYTPDRKGEHPQEHLRSFRGTLEADAYAGFGQLYESGRIQEAACWAHLRRKF
jgi:transposase